MFVLARTNRDAPRHRGISMLLVPIDQPAVEVRPIRNITGDTDFNEVFFDGAVTERELVVGEVDGGWPVAMTLLGFERGEAALHAPIRFRSELDRLTSIPGAEIELRLFGWWVCYRGGKVNWRVRLFDHGIGVLRSA